MKTPVIALLIISIAIPCYAQGYLGVSVEEVDGQLVVEDVHPYSPGAKCGIRRGDIIVAIDGRHIPSGNDFELLLLGRESGDYITVTYLQRRRKKIARVKLERLVLPPEEIILRRQLLTGENIKLAIMILEVNIIAPYQVPEEQNRRWEDALKNVVLGYQENYFLEEYVGHNFSLVDRGNVEQVLNEISFSASGFVSDTERTKISSLLQATHIYGISIVKTIDEKGWSTEVQTRKLIEIQSGKILASSMVTTERDKRDKVKESHNSWEEGLEYGQIKIGRPKRYKTTIDERIDERKRLYQQRRR